MPMQNELPKQGLSIDPRELAAMREDFFADRANRSAMRAVTNAGLAAAARDPLTVGQQRHHFSVNVKQGKITERTLLDVRGAQHDALCRHAALQSRDIRIFTELSSVLRQIGKGQFVP